MTSEHERFSVVYAPELAQYVVEHGAARERVRVVPTVLRTSDAVALRDPDASVRAAELCAVLNRVYAEPSDDAPAPASDWWVPAPGGTAWDEHDDDAAAPY